MTHLAPVAERAAEPQLPNRPAMAQKNCHDDIFIDLVKNHSTRLHRFIIRQIGNCPDAEDLAQQAFLEAARSYDTFRGESQLSTWLYGIALNLVRNYLSRAPECRYYFVNEEVLIDRASHEPAPDFVAEQNQTMAMLENTLEELPTHMREILLMMGFNGYTYEEAADRVGVPVGTIRSRLSRARAELRRRLNDKGFHFDD